MHAHSYAHMHTHIHAQEHMHTPLHSRVYTHMHIQAHTHKHSHTQGSTRRPQSLLLQQERWAGSSVAQATSQRVSLTRHPGLQLQEPPRQEGPAGCPALTPHRCMGLGLLDPECPPHHEQSGRRTTPCQGVGVERLTSGRDFHRAQQARLPHHRAPLGIRGLWPGRHGREA